MTHVKSLCRIPTKKYVSWVLVSWVLASASWSLIGTKVGPFAQIRLHARLHLFCGSGQADWSGVSVEEKWHITGKGSLSCFVYTGLGPGFGGLCRGLGLGPDECNWWVPLTALLLSGLTPPRPRVVSSGQIHHIGRVAVSAAPRVGHRVLR